MSDRPYPEGLAWDEAWRQRQAKDKALAQVAMQKRVVSDTQNDVEMLDIDLATLRREVEEALQLDGGYSTLRELIAACLEARALAAGVSPPRSAKGTDDE